MDMKVGFYVEIVTTDKPERVERLRSILEREARHAFGKNLIGVKRIDIFPQVDQPVEEISLPKLRIT